MADIKGLENIDTPATSLSANSNASYLQWRNVGDTADIDILSLNASNDTILNTVSGQDILFQSDGTTNWRIFGTGDNELLKNAGVGTIGTYTLNPFYIKTNNVNQLKVTTNGNLQYSANDSNRFYLYAVGKTKQLYLTGGDASGATAGATITLEGGDSGGVGTGGYVYLNAVNDNNIEFQADGTTYWEMDGSGNLISNSTNNIRFKNNSLSIYAISDDASDNLRLILGGGGGVASSRGGYVRCHGNEFTDSNLRGGIDLIAGNVDSSGDISFYVQGDKTWSVRYDKELMYEEANGFIGVKGTSAHNGRLYLSSTTAVGTDGAFAQLFGDNHSTNAGDAYLTTGNATGAYLYLRAAASNGYIVFQTAGSNSRWGISSLGNLFPYVAGTTNCGGTGNRVLTFYSINSLNYTSDERLKENVTYITPASALEAIGNLAPIKYNLIEGYSTDSAKTRAGFKAQHAQTYIPEAVTEGDSNPSLQFGDEGFEEWSMQGDQIVPYLVAAVQELKAKYDALESRVGTLESA